MTQAEYAISRLTAWLRDYGDAKNPEFVSDIKSILTEVARLNENLNRLHTPHPFDDWHEDIGNVLWWSFPIGEPPYSGTPYDNDYPFEYDDPSVGWVPLPDCDKIQERWETAEKTRNP